MIIFNVLKHHKQSIIDFIDTNNEINNIELNKIGASLMDLYIGNLSVSEIKDEVKIQLKNNGIVNESHFSNWLAKHNNFVIISLSDSSFWVLLKGNELENYVHIHPARYSNHTIRVKSGTLKTAIAFHILKIDDFDTEKINYVRVLLGLSPIKNILDCGGIIEMIKILRKEKR